MQTKITGIALIVIGIIMIVYTEFNFTTTEKVVDVGPVEINKKKNHSLRWPPVVGAALLVVGGIVVIVLPKKKTT